MKNKHTPGPWEVHEDPRFPFRISIRNSHETILGMDRTSFSTEQETLSDCREGKGFSEKNGEAQLVREGIANQEANARLIAASPTMYDYIKRQAWNGDKEARKLIETIDPEEE